jgi:hypothetical protein
MCEEKDNERDDIKDKCQDHGPATAECICDNARGDLEKIHSDLPHGIQHPDCKKTKPFLQEEEDEESFEEPEVLEETVKAKTIILYVLIKAGRHMVKIRK